MAIDLRNPDSPYINFSVTQDPTIPLGGGGGQGGEVGIDDADPGATRAVWPGWEQVKGANNLTYWVNRSDTNWPEGTWLDPRTDMAMDPTSGQWISIAELTAGGKGGTQQPRPGSGGGGIPTSLPATGQTGRVYSVFNPTTGRVQDYVWDPEAIPDDPSTGKLGNWKTQGTGYYPQTDDPNTPRVDSPAQTTAANASATSAAASMLNAQTNKDQLAEQITQNALQLEQQGKHFEAQLELQRGIALGVINNQDTLATLQYKHQVKMDLDRFNLDSSKFDWTKKIDEAQLTGYYMGEPTLANLIQTAGLTGFYKDKPTLAKLYGDADRLGVLNGQPTLAAKELGLRADLGYADSRRADLALNLGRQQQAYSQFDRNRQFQLDLMRDPESYVAAAFMAAGREAPQGTALAEQLAQLNASRPQGVEEFLNAQAGYKPTEPPPGAGLYNPAGQQPAPAAASPETPNSAALAPEPAPAPPTAPAAQPSGAPMPMPAYDTPEWLGAAADAIAGGGAAPTPPAARMLTLDPFAEPEPTAVHAPPLAAALAGNNGAVQNNVFGAPSAFERAGAGSLAMPAPKPITVAGPRDTYSGPAALAPGAQPLGAPKPVRTVAGPRDTYSGPAALHPSNAGQLLPGAAPATPAGPRKLNLADIRNTGMMPPQLDRALTPIGTGPGTRSGQAEPGGFGWKPPGGLRPMSRQTFHALQPTEQQALRGTVSSLGGKSAATNYFADIDRRSRGLRQRL